MFIHNVHLHLFIPNFIAQASYAWKIAGFTTCTASCLGGLQESIVICVETEKENPVAPYFCDPHKRLEIEVGLNIFSSNISSSNFSHQIFPPSNICLWQVRTCNENPCPPRWNVSDFRYISLHPPNQDCLFQLRYEL